MALIKSPLTPNLSLSFLLSAPSPCSPSPCLCTVPKAIAEPSVHQLLYTRTWDTEWPKAAKKDSSPQRYGVSQKAAVSFCIGHPYTRPLWQRLTGNPVRPQEKSLKIGLISDFQLVHIGVTGRALRLAHIPDKGTSEPLEQPSPKNPDGTFKVQQHHPI